MNKKALRQFLVDSNKAGYAGGEEKRSGLKSLMVRQQYLLRKVPGSLMIISLAVNLMEGEQLYILG